MKKIILSTSIVISIILILTFGEGKIVFGKGAISGDLESKYLEKNESSLIMNYYSDKIKGATSIKEYKETKDHVIISFHGTDVRVITSKNKFDLIIGS